MPKAGVVKHDKEHIRRSFLRPIGRRPGGLRDLRRASDHAGERGSGFVFFQSHGVSPCWSTPRRREEKAIPDVLSSLLSNTHASARRRSHGSLSMAAARVSPAFREGAPVARRRRQAAPPPSSWLRRTWAKDAGPLCSWSKASHRLAPASGAPIDRRPSHWVGPIASRARLASVAQMPARPASFRTTSGVIRIETRSIRLVIWFLPLTSHVAGWETWRSPRKHQ